MLVLAAGMAFIPPNNLSKIAMPTTNEKSPCSVQPPTNESCWNCFLWLLEDCDKKNTTQDRRKACYDGANTYLSSCLGKTTFTFAKITYTDWNMVTGTVINTVSSGSKEFNEVKVYNRTNGKLTEVESFNFNGIIVVPGFVTGNNVNLVIQCLDNKKTVNGFSIILNNNLDLNSDGEIDDLDVIEALDNNILEEYLELR